jgi:hypothetical protein
MLENIIIAIVGLILLLAISAAVNFVFDLVFNTGRRAYKKRERLRRSAQKSFGDF